MSCSSDNDVINDIDPQQKSRTTPAPAQEENYYLALKFWASDDLLDIADVTCTGLVANYSFTKASSITTLTDQVVNGKSGALVEAPANMEAKITFTLKENWEEIINGKDHLSLITAKSEVREKGGEAKFNTNNLKGHIVEVARVDAEKLQMVLDMCNYSITVK